MKKPNVGKKITCPIKPHDDRISPDKRYLVKWCGEWYIGRFNKQWYGWNFKMPLSVMVGLQYDSIETIYEFKEND